MQLISRLVVGDIPPEAYFPAPLEPLPNLVISYPTFLFDAHNSKYTKLRHRFEPRELMVPAPLSPAEPSA